MSGSMMRLLRVGIPALVLVAGLGLAYRWVWQGDAVRQAGSGQATSEGQAPGRRGALQGRQGPVPVTVTEVKARPVPVTFSAIGTVQPIASLPIRTRLDSQVMRVAVEEGARVAQGDLLFALDDSLLRAQLAQIEGQLARDEAQIAQATRDLARADELLARKIDTPVQRDTAETNLKALQAQKAADLGQRQNILVQIGFTEIRAPVAGRIGSISAKAGAIVRAADTQALATLNQIDPIYVASAIPQAVLPDLKAAMAKGPVAVEASVGDARAQGVVAFVENAIDAGTGTVMLRSRFANAGETLWPGAFVRVTITLGTDPQALTVPLVAIQNGQSGPYVFAVDAANRAVLKTVRLARQDGDTAVVAEGLASGDRVVTSGQLRIVAGAPVAIVAAEARN